MLCFAMVNVLVSCLIERRRRMDGYAECDLTIYHGGSYDDGLNRVLRLFKRSIVDDSSPDPFWNYWLV